MDFVLENELRPEIGKNEKLLWTGKPRTGIVFRFADVFLIPFSMLWFGFALFWEYMALKGGISIMSLFGLPFIVIGSYVFAGRFFADSLSRKNTIYGVTDTRVIIRSGIFQKSTQSLNIRAMSDLIIKEKKDGTGTILFGPADALYRQFNGMRTWRQTQPSSLEMIEEVRKVYNIIVEQQGK